MPRYGWNKNREAAQITEAKEVDSVVRMLSQDAVDVPRQVG